MTSGSVATGESASFVEDEDADAGSVELELSAQLRSPAAELGAASQREELSWSARQLFAQPLVQPVTVRAVPGFDENEDSASVELELSAQLHASGAFRDLLRAAPDQAECPQSSLQGVPVGAECLPPSACEFEQKLGTTGLPVEAECLPPSACEFEQKLGVASAPEPSPADADVEALCEAVCRRRVEELGCELRASLQHDLRSDLRISLGEDIGEEVRRRVDDARAQLRGDPLQVPPCHSEGKLEALCEAVSRRCLDGLEAEMRAHLFKDLFSKLRDSLGEDVCAEVHAVVDEVRQQLRDEQLALHRLNEARSEALAAALKHGAGDRCRPAENCHQDAVEAMVAELAQLRSDLHVLDGRLREVSATHDALAGEQEEWRISLGTMERRLKATFRSALLDATHTAVSREDLEISEQRCVERASRLSTESATRAHRDREALVASAADLERRLEARVQAVELRLKTIGSFAAGDHRHYDVEERLLELERQTSLRESAFASAALPTAHARPLRETTGMSRPGSAVQSGQISRALEALQGEVDCFAHNVKRASMSSQMAARSAAWPACLSSKAVP
eukprot:TRINITY_DN14876_c0_g1_i1.p1 TRINITY_DN14876_c0_g1~~TRINITY_DN14876_c0_g1_i1.p1  ORF type:complete len:569 (+),score=123.93 TRINITY_DN14876_c0_g1_i1:3-1709(+)